MDHGASSWSIPDDAEAASEGSEVELVKASQNGDRAAFGILIKRHQNAVAAVAFALTGRFSLGEDVTQEAFITAWRDLRNLREPERFRGWLMTVARRCCLLALRDRRAVPEETTLGDAAHDLPSRDPSPLDSAISREEEMFLWSALKRIPERYRMPLVLSCRGYTSTSLARTFDTSEENVRQRVTRGRRMLQQHVTEMLASALERRRLGADFAAAVVALLAVGASPGPAAARGQARRWSRAKAVAAAAIVGAAVTGGLVVGRRPAPGTSSRPAGGGPSQLSLQMAGVPGLRKLAASILPDLPAVGSKATADTTVARGTVVLGFDFEEGLLPEGFQHGHVVPGPFRPGSRYAAMGTVIFPEGGLPSSVVRAEIDVAYRETMVLTFDYWKHSGTDGLQVSVRDADRGCNFQVSASGVTKERWGHAAFRLSTFPTHGTCGFMQAGDRLTKLEIYGGPPGGHPFYVDDIRLVDYAKDDLETVVIGPNL